MKKTMFAAVFAAAVFAALIGSCASSGPSREEYQALQERLNQLEQQQQSAPAQTSIQGAWEIRNGGNVWVISFIEGTFVIFRNGEMYQYGTYTLNPSAWGVTVTSNRPQNLLIEFGFERSYNGFTYNISANELILSNPLRSHDGYLILGQGGLPLGTYRRGSEPTEARNPLIGIWRQDYNEEGKDFFEKWGEYRKR